MVRLPPILPILATLIALLVLGIAQAEERLVPAETGSLAEAIAGASPGDVLILAPGRHDGPVVLEFSVTLDGRGEATIDGNGQGDVIRVAGPDVTVRGLTIIGSGNDHPVVDSGVKLDRTAERALVENNVLIENLVGVHVFGAKDSVIRGNIIKGRQGHRMNDRGNGVYVWNAPGTVVEHNIIRYGRDGIFVNASRQNVFAHNDLSDLRFAIHYMFTHDSELVGNRSRRNHAGWAIMYSERLEIRDNVSEDDRDHGLLLNTTNRSHISGNIVRRSNDKCVFMYNANRNRFVDNWFERCPIGIHFTAGSEGNVVSGNAFVLNRSQVKYVGTRYLDWAHEGRGNYWSDNPAFDLDGDGIADRPYRPNDVLDEILWTLPQAKALINSPAVQAVRWAQSRFPALYPGGVIDTAPLMQPPALAAEDTL
jgi:nitrous oxidase accessory protein